MESQDIQAVLQSFGRCTLSDDFLITFYDILTRSSNEIAAMFAHTDMRRQRGLLREALVHLISFNTGNDFATRRIAELTASHARDQLKVRPELYEIWIDSLVKAVRRHDAQCTPDLEAAWRRVAEPGIAAMRAGYDARARDSAADTRAVSRSD